MRHSFAVAIACLVVASSGAAAVAADPGPLVRALWLVQRYGTAEAADGRNDQRVKGELFKALGKEGELTLSEVRGFMEPDTFKKLAGSDDRLSPAEIGKAVETAVPASRGRLLPKIRSHADYLTTSFDMIDETHRQAGGKLADWIAKNYRPGQPLDVVVVCTGNSRRSIIGATMGNIAAAYYGMPEIRFHSGGTAPTAFNSRTVAALKEIGVEIEPTGKEAARGEPQTANPVYRVRWGLSSEPGVEAMEFSKRYDDPSNPQHGFAALMVCGEADAACPVVKGSALRVSMPYLDPKIYDGGAYESAKYAERRDDMGRLMLAVMMQARQRVAAAGTHPEGSR
jgi:arsenate reductase